ncbi:outer membrane protein OmpK [uncultured Cetobacterium sp.]|uniref:outer membrane protein OmpK n=1 Tax=uncultured Cetobacterium sp. TaxID=527638 RepID=UPI002629202C|nr:outer membrane protein OmpK [uncultured Cetobacterium sp.]
MLKKYLLCGAICLSTLSFAKYEPWNFNLLEVGIIKNNSLPNGFGPSVKDTVFEIQGTTRYNLLDLYWFVDRSNIFNSNSLSDKKNDDSNYTYLEFNPRVSMDGLFNKNLSVGPINEWFFSYNFDYDNTYGIYKGLKKHYFGIGNYINVPGFDYFKTNIYKRFIEKNYSRNENNWDGYMFNSSYGATLYKFNNGMKFTFSGWMDYVFGAKKIQSYDTSSSLQWQNQVRLFFNDNISLSYTYQINKHFSEVNQFSSNRNQSAIGLHYSIIF